MVVIDCICYQKWNEFLRDESFDWNVDFLGKTSPKREWRRFPGESWSRDGFLRTMLSVWLHKITDVLRFYFCGSNWRSFLCSCWCLQSAGKFTILRFSLFVSEMLKKFSNWSKAADKPRLHSWCILFIHALVVGGQLRDNCPADTMWVIFLSFVKLRRNKKSFFRWKITKRKSFAKLNGMRRSQHYRCYL